ncbi:BnaC04g19860D [Brassica napus]|uniref:BnaC04g19860D protein n=1 Tax=Brassica napus TaxID=3708 RepID=A0A078F6E6_BRANA|nr:BnaC04g19860D [Brassica napus]
MSLTSRPIPTLAKLRLIPADVSLFRRGEMAFVDTLMMPQIDPRSVNGGPSMHEQNCLDKHV